MVVDQTMERTHLLVQRSDAQHAPPPVMQKPGETGGHDSRTSSVVTCNQWLLRSGSSSWHENQTQTWPGVLPQARATTAQREDG
ncbi:hypothetical protein EJB05_02427 [Eragrostis curvula]|uniref:Uncharacterized protein n=1 Tax=Eragrostis curvula TaxID=38414 RepID=A0A5J9WV06_9POAL|nr:hypothetical protein EJB05_02427 [Eragrostis curvula]